MDENKIRKKADRIINDAEDIKEEVKERRGRAFGDPLVEMD